MSEGPTLPSRHDFADRRTHYITAELICLQEVIAPLTSIALQCGAHPPRSRPRCSQFKCKFERSGTIIGRDCLLVS